MSPMTKMRKISIALVIVAVIIVASFATIYLSGFFNPSPTPSVKDTLTYALPINPSTIDFRRILSTQETIPALLASDSLINQEWDVSDNGTMTLELSPALVTSWSLYNDTTWKFTLRQGVKFHSGKIMTAYDVKYTFDSLYDPNFPAQEQWAVQPYKRMQIVDNYTILVSSDQPYGPGAAARFSFVHVPGAVNEENAKLWGINYGQPGNPPLEDGTGPYKLVEWKSTTDRMVFERFDDYWGDKPSIKTIIIMPIPDAVTRVLALETHTVDAIGTISPSDGKNVKQLGFTVNSVAQTRPHWLGINCMKPPFNDTRVRQALNYAIDRNQLINTLWSGQAVKGNVYLPYIFGYADTPIYEYNVTKARELLVAAGYPNGFTFDILVYKGRLTLHEEEVQAVAGMWQQIGVTANVKLLTWADYLAQMKPEAVKPYPAQTPAYDMFSISWNDMLGDPDYNLQIFNVNDTDYPIGGHYLNGVFRLNDTELDGWINQQRHMTDSSARKQLLGQIIQRTVSDAPLIFLYFETMTWAWDPKLNGLQGTPVEVIKLQTAYWTT